MLAIAAVVAPARRAVGAEPGSASLDAKPPPGPGPELLREAWAARCSAQTRPSLRVRCEQAARLYATTARALWWTAAGPSPQAQALSAALRDAAKRGLEPAHYAAGARAARPAAAPVSPAEQAERDVTLSIAALRFASDLQVGRVPPPDAGFAVLPQADAHDLLADVVSLARAQDVEAALDAMDPPFAAYGLLESALAHYRALARDASLTVALPDRIVRPGEPLREAPALRRRLAATGDLRAKVADPDAPVYDTPLAAAVRRFQRRHGLSPDGILGPDTAAALAVPLAERVRQIEYALERFRWLPHRFASPPLAVNIPELRLFALREEGGRYVRSDEDLSMRVIVGEAWERQTPVFHSDLQRIVFWPYWHVPSSIVREEMLPAILRDPGHLERQQLEIVARYGADETLPPSPDNLARLGRDELRLRQRPGRHNALGLVKFLLPNPYRVYLHGTPERWLFAEERRALSHGCIRVEDPLALARYVLRDEPGWTPERIETALAGPDTLELDVTHPVPVYVLYATAVARSDGSVHFFEDLYGLDTWLRILLDGIPPDAARACSDAAPHCAYGSLASHSGSSP